MTTRNMLKIFLVFSTTLQSCSFFNIKTPATPSLKHEAPANVEVLEKSFLKSEFSTAISDFSPNRIRLVPITQSATQGGPIPEYRLFSIDKKSAYDLLGLENGDILVSVEGFMIDDMDKFPAYIMLVQSQPKGEIEIRREGKPYLIKFSLVTAP